MGIVALFPFIVLAIPGYYYAEEAITESVQSHLRSSNNSKAQKIKVWLQSTQKDLSFATQSNCLKGLCTGSCPTKVSSDSCPFLSAVLISHPSYVNIVAYDSDGKIISQAGKDETCGKNEPSNYMGKKLSGSDEFIVSPDFCFENEHTIIEVRLPISSVKNEKAAIVSAHLNLSDAFNPIIRSSLLRNTEKTYIVSKSGQILYPPAEYPERLQKQHYLGTFLSDNDAGRTYLFNDFRNVPVIATFTPVPQTDWYIIAEIDKEAAYKSLNVFTVRTGHAIVMSLIIVVAATFLISRKLSFPLRELAKIAKSIASGKHWKRAPQFKDLEVREVGDAFNLMLDKLKITEKVLAKSSSLSAIGELSASVVHEMRNPVSSIKMNLQALSQTGQDEKNSLKMIEIALEQLNRVESMLTDILNYGKPLQLHQEKIKFGQLIDFVTNDLRKEIEEKKLSVQVDDLIGDELLCIDIELMTRAISNLVLNAAHWSPKEGSIIISGKKSPIREGWYTIKVEDNGPGIYSQNLKKIFRPFFTTRENGTGLGLSNTKKIVEYHSGGISVSSNKNNGAVFTIHLPIKGSWL